MLVNIVMYLVVLGVFILLFAAVGFMLFKGRGISAFDTLISSLKYMVNSAMGSYNMD